ncbi:MAG TPA: cell division protein FtsA [Patescibacteria group bacterium]|jgi:cell division protein FtsA|nr:cell division protein FtsA [Patescibacteria group bacterium]
MIGGNRRSYITSIDIGTTKICVLVARVLDQYNLEIIGVGKTISEGLSKGVVVDIAKAVYAIGQAVKEAEIMAGLSINSAVIGISGGHISSQNSHGIVPIKKQEIRVQDIESVLAAASAIPLKENQKILHVLPQYFMLDGREIVYDPLGMYGIRLEVEAHIILGAIASVQNLINCCERVQIVVEDIILEQLASADAVLTADERMLGVAILDIGGGTADLAVYHQGSIRHTMVLPIAGNHFTHDLAIGLCTTTKAAEYVKKQYGIVHEAYLDTDMLIECETIQQVQKKIIMQRDVLEILRPRAIELFSLIKKELISKKLQGYMPMGLVLTGGGSLLCGMQEIAQEVFAVPIRVGKPHIAFDLPQTLQNPMYATGYGMLIHALKKEAKYGANKTRLTQASHILERMKSWIIDLF